MNSCLYFGHVRHRRFVPHEHEFNFPLFMAYLDLDELETVFSQSRLWSNQKANVAWLRRADYIEPAHLSIKDAVIEQLHRHGIDAFEGSVRMLAHLRYYGHCFNPVTFYFCFKPGVEEPAYLVADVHNTPWNERHIYVLSYQNHGAQTKPGSKTLRDKTVFEFEKAFHVSPFNPMDMDYRWSVQVPGEGLQIHINALRAQHKWFDATLELHREAITASAMNRVLWRYPVMTFQVAFGIYWQALRLWLRKTPLFDHPANHSDIGRN